jgi:hypothetical protein
MPLLACVALRLPVGLVIYGRLNSTTQQKTGEIGVFALRLSAACFRLVYSYADFPYQYPNLNLRPIAELFQIGLMRLNSISVERNSPTSKPMMGINQPNDGFASNRGFPHGADRGREPPLAGSPIFPKLENRSRQQIAKSALRSCGGRGFFFVSTEIHGTGVLLKFAV